MKVNNTVLKGLVFTTLFIMYGYASAQTFTTPGTFTYTVPANVKSIKVEVWGAGGSGGTSTNGAETGGGGGGAYSSSTLTVTPGSTFTVFVGSGGTASAAGGDSYFGSATTIMAKGGGGASGVTAGTGGVSTSGFGTLKYSGGNGRNGLSGSYGGGGGASAGSSANGITATTATGAIAPLYGGNGGNGRTGTTGSGTAGLQPGGGGGGAFSTVTASTAGGAGAAGMVKITNYLDTDGDGYTNSTPDLDSDNDGIPDALEMYCDQSTPPNGSWPVSTDPATPPLITRQILFFDWSGVTLSPTSQTATKTVTLASGITYTATVSNYTSNATPDNTLKGNDINTWLTGPQQMVWRYYDVNGTTFKEVFYSPDNATRNTGTASLTFKVTATYNGVEYPVDLIVFDPESTNPSTTVPEKLSYTTNASPFKFLQKTGTGTIKSTLITGEGTQTITYLNTESSVEADAVNAFYITTGYSPTVNATMVMSGSLQGVGFAVRLYCDTDNDGIPSFMDLDSDGDGCYDAVEGADNVLPSQLNPDGSINSSVDANGVPILVNSGGTADADGVQGQGIGSSADPNYIALACNDVKANDDTYTALEGRPMTTESVIINDVVNGAPAVIGTAPGTVSLNPTGTWPSGIVLNTGTGEINIAGTVPKGTYTMTYSICLNGFTPANCSIATVTIIVIPCAAGEYGPVIK